MSRVGVNLRHELQSALKTQQNVSDIKSADSLEIKVRGSIVNFFGTLVGHHLLQMIT